MAEPESATRAPESDAHENQAPKEPSMISTEDSAAQKGASMGDHCVTDRPIPENSPQPSGEISKIADIEVYISKPSDYPHTPSKLLLFLSNGSGIHSKNNQIQADKYASEGFLVIMPDQFAGDPAPNVAAHTNEESEENQSVVEQLKMGLATTAKSFMLDMWLARQTREKVLPILHKVVNGTKEEFADAIASGGGIYGVGYCFGGKYICVLASESPDDPAHEENQPKDEGVEISDKAPVIKAGALAHGTLIGKEDLENIKSPVSMACVENDQLFPDEVRTAGQEFLEKNKIEHEIKIYPGVPHGFAVLGEYEDPKIHKAQQEAFEQMLGWLKKH